MAEAFEQEITTLYEAREQKHEASAKFSFSPAGPRLSNLSLERFRNSIKRSQSFQASCLHPENRGEGEEMGRAMSIDVAILPYGYSFLCVSDGSWTLSWLLQLAP
jgi:hypothetical protein